MLSKRLKAIADLAKDSKVVLDVGCDHGLLSIYLSGQGKKVIASDIAPMPLEAAKRNIEIYNIENNITAILAPGLKAINDEVDTVIIAGMGRSTIETMIDEDFDLLKSVKQLIVSPHTEVYKFRKYISNKGFIIKDEMIIYDSKKYYIILSLEKGKISYSDDELYFGPIFIKQRPSLFIDYCTKELDKKRTIKSNLTKNNSKLDKEILRLKNFINS